MKKVVFLLFSLIAITASAQMSSFEEYHKQKEAQFNKYKQDKQDEYDAFRKHANDSYAEFMRKAWQMFEVFDADKPEEEKPIPPVVYAEHEPAQEPVPQQETKPELKQEPATNPQPRQDVIPEPKPEPEPKMATGPEPKPIPVQPTVVVVPEPAPAPEPIAPVKQKEEQPFKRVSVAYYGNIVSIGFPMNDDLKLKTLDENSIADSWKQLSDSRYDITIKNALDLRKSADLCDWAYMDMLQTVTEKQYGKTNEAVLMQAYLMTQSGYRIRLGMTSDKLHLLVASRYDIFGLKYIRLDGTKFYIIGNRDKQQLRICEAKFDKEKPLSLQITRLPKFGSDPTPKRTLTSKKGVTSSVSVNKNMIDFFNTYPQACFNGDQTTRWAAYANTPMEKTVKDMLYPSLKKTITGMSERDAVGIILNWVQTAFEYEYDDKVWGGDRAFFAQETLYYPYCDCEDRAILFSRLVRDLVGLDVVLLYYPGHLATAVAFSGEVNGDYLTYKNRKYVVCDPTFINAGVGRTMPGMDNQKAQVIALK